MDEERFDYVIVGAGSAGCVVAERLSGDPGVGVLVLEAGGDDRHRDIRTPAAFPRLFHSFRDWNDWSVPQAEAGGRSLYHPRGKVLGGCSSINAMLYVRGNPLDYDGWAARGNDGWSWSDLRPWFLRLESNVRGASPFHGAEGPLRVEDQRAVHPLSREFLRAAAEAGFTRNDDFNGEAQEGFGLYQVTQRRGRRWSAADAFLRPALSRPNLELRLNAAARRIVVEADRAVGVEYLREGRLVRASVRREVVLCAGAYRSPHLLLLSGIGAAGALAQLGIARIRDLPGVGRNLQDHTLVPLVVRCRRRGTLDDAERLPGGLVHLARYLLLRRGPFTSPLAEAGGFARSHGDLEAPDLQYHFAPAFFMEHGAVRPPGHGFSLGITLLTPGSSGTVTLASPDPDDPPRIDPRFLTDEADLVALVEGFRIADRIMHAPALESWREEYVQPGRRLVEEDEIRDHIRSTVEHIYHPVGTCRMGRDRLAVVGPDLKVHGVAGLRVVDASVMPAVVRGNTNAPTLALAARGADLIARGA